MNSVASGSCAPVSFERGPLAMMYRQARQHRSLKDTRQMTADILSLGSAGRFIHFLQTALAV